MREDAVPKTSLLTRIVLTNTAVVAVAVLILALSPATVSSPAALKEIILLAGGLAAIVLINLALVRRALAPLGHLTAAMRNVDVLGSGQRIPVYGDDPQVIQLTEAYNAMLKDLRAERRESVQRSLAAQESERRRIARELHDEVGQSLTALVLQLERVSRSVPEPARRDLTDAREAARSSLEDARAIAQRLRPEALDDLGLVSALSTLSKQLSDRAAIRIEPPLDGKLPPLSPEAELVIYRVAQESLTNVVRHADASQAVLSLSCAPGRILVSIVDDGRGINGTRPGAGIQGMRERALMVGGELSVRSRSQGGTEVRLELPNEALQR